MSESEQTSGALACWILPKATVDGVDYVCLRTVNKQGEINVTNSKDDLSQTVWEHVPSVKFTYGADKPVPGVDDALAQAQIRIATDWPALANGASKGEIKVTPRLGGYGANGKVEPVMLVALDLGNVSALPDVVFKPGEELKFARQPITWVRADAIQQKSFDKTNPVVPEVLAGEDYKTVYVTPNATVIQGTVAEGFIRGFGMLFTPAPAAGSVLDLKRPGAESTEPTLK